MIENLNLTSDKTYYSEFTAHSSARCSNCDNSGDANNIYTIKIISPSPVYFRDDSAAIMGTEDEGLLVRFSCSRDEMVNVTKNNIDITEADVKRYFKPTESTTIEPLLDYRLRCGSGLGFNDDFECGCDDSDIYTDYIDVQLSNNITKSEFTLAEDSKGTGDITITHKDNVMIVISPISAYVENEPYLEVSNKGLVDYLNNYIRDHQDEFR